MAGDIWSIRRYKTMIACLMKLYSDTQNVKAGQIIVKQKMSQRKKCDI